MQIAECINTSSSDIIFTSGGSESNNWVINAAVKFFKATNSESFLKPHIITSAVEHDSISVTLSVLQKEGVIGKIYKISLFQLGIISTFFILFILTLYFFL